MQSSFLSSVNSIFEALVEKATFEVTKKQISNNENIHDIVAR